MMLSLGSTTICFGITIRMLDGLFIPQDPIGLVGGINFYQYVHDPMHWIDPMGLDDARPGKNLADEGGVRIVESWHKRCG